MAPLSGSVTVNYPVVTLPASGPESYPSDSVDPIHLHSKSTSVHTVTSRFASAPGDAQVQKVTGPGALKTRGHHTATTQPAQAAGCSTTTTQAKLHPSNQAIISTLSDTRRCLNEKESLSLAQNQNQNQLTPKCTGRVA